MERRPGFLPTMQARCSIQAQCFNRVPKHEPPSNAINSLDICLQRAFCRTRFLFKPLLLEKADAISKEPKIYNPITVIYIPVDNNFNLNEATFKIFISNDESNRSSSKQFRREKVSRSKFGNTRNEIDLNKRGEVRIIGITGRRGSPLWPG